jgi:hypothetical protein
MISGPKQHVEMVDVATTDRLVISGTANREAFTTTVNVADPMVQVVRPVPIHVTITR